MVTDKPVYLLLADGLIAGKSEHVMCVELAWQSSFDIAKQRQHRERGRRADNGSKPKPDAYQDADGCGDPDGGSRR